MRTNFRKEVKALLRTRRDIHRQATTQSEFSRRELADMTKAFLGPIRIDKATRKKELREKRKREG